MKSKKTVEAKENWRVVSINGEAIKDKQDLFDIFSKKLNFPSYFGNNWDAFWDCITDLEWLGDVQVIIKIRKIECIKDKITRKNLVELLADASRYWKKRGKSFKILEC